MRIPGFIPTGEIRRMPSITQFIERKIARLSRRRAYLLVLSIPGLGLLGALPFEWGKPLSTYSALALLPCACRFSLPQ
jgi:hypothetical protein